MNLIEFIEAARARKIEPEGLLVRIQAVAEYYEKISKPPTQADLNKVYSL